MNLKNKKIIQRYELCEKNKKKKEEIVGKKKKEEKKKEKKINYEI